METGAMADDDAAVVVVAAAVVVVVEFPDWPAGGVAVGDVELPQAAARTETLAVKTRAEIRVQRMFRCPFVAMTSQSYPVGRRSRGHRAAATLCRDGVEPAPGVRESG
jgi:hypothetical protein